MTRTTTLLIVGLLLAAGCQASNDEILFGASLPLSGEAAAFGEAMKAGMDLAVQDINAEGGINGKPLRIIYEDDTCSPKAVQAINKLVNVDRVVALHGPLCSAAAGPGIPIAEKAGIVTMVHGTAPGLADDPLTFRIWPSDSFAGEFAAKHAHDDLGARRAAVIFAQNDWGAGMNDRFTSAFEALGGAVVLTEAVSVDDRDFRTILAKARAQQADLLFIPTYPEQSGSLVSQARDAGLQVPILGGEILDVEEFTSVPDAEGVEIVFLDLSMDDAFAQRARDLGASPNVATPLGYDGVMMVAEAMRQAGTTEGTAVANVLSTMHYQGISNDIVLDDNGEINSGKYVIKEVRDGQAIIVG